MGTTSLGTDLGTKLTRYTPDFRRGLAAIAPSRTTQMDAFCLSRRRSPVRVRLGVSTVYPGNAGFRFIHMNAGITVAPRATRSGNGRFKIRLTPVSTPPRRDITCRLAVKRFALGPASRRFGAGGASHPLGGSEVGAGAPTCGG